MKVCLDSGKWLVAFWISRVQFVERRGYEYDEI